ncbi:GDSL-like lipase/acylhydrolase domain protein [Verrucomicrobiia bacterium DG1235]|nr:GDSL-like lipase/acylhydrolase domain protein [Verrucomicrobiae bacterium DG1235]
MEDVQSFKVACLGDSHTRGTFGYSWFRELECRLAGDGVEMANFGVNGELAYNAGLRLGEVLAFEPDLVVVLLGTNDVNAIASPSLTQRYVERGGLPQTPDKEFFVQSLEQIVVSLKTLQGCELILVSLPLLGEVLDHVANRLVDDYNREIFQICEAHGLGLVDLNERMKAALADAGKGAFVPHQDGRRLMLVSMAKHYLLFRGWDAISRSHGLRLLTDTIHLNERSGRMLVEMLSERILRQMGPR